jgi:hypothetical protein
MKLISIKEAGRRLNPRRPLSYRRITQLIASGALPKYPWPDAPDRRVKVGVTPQAVAALRKQRANR